MNSTNSAPNKAPKSGAKVGLNSYPLAKPPVQYCGPYLKEPGYVADWTDVKFSPFMSWLFAQHARGDVIGDLAFYAGQDPNLAALTSLQEIEDYLIAVAGGRHELLMTVREAWREWQAAGCPTGDGTRSPARPGLRFVWPRSHDAVGWGSIDDDRIQSLVDAGLGQDLCKTEAWYEAEWQPPPTRPLNYDTNDRLDRIERKCGWFKATKSSSDVKVRARRFTIIDDCRFADFDTVVDGVPPSCHEIEAEQGGNDDHSCKSCRFRGRILGPTQLADDAAQPDAKACAALVATRVEEAKNDNGTILEPDFVFAMLVTETKRRPEAQRAQQRLKQLKVPVGPLKRAVKDLRLRMAIGGSLRPAASIGKKPKPQIVVREAEHEVVKEALAALVKADGLYERGGSIVRVSTAPRIPMGIARRGEPPKIDQLHHSVLRTALAGCASWIKRDFEGGFAPAYVPNWAVKSLFHLGHWPKMRLLVGVVETPVFRRDGTLLINRGYDPETGLYYHPTGPIPSVPDKPSRADAVKACKELLEVVVDFPFADPEHASAWLASVITPVTRFAYSGPAPLTLVDANTRGAGKGMLVDVGATILVGREMEKMANREDDAEMRKTITSIALRGTPMVLIDNIEGRLGGPSLDSALTTTSWSDRLLGGNQTVSLELYTTWWATGNNVELQGDTSRRVLHIRLDSPEENPETKAAFAHPDLLGWVADQRPRLLSAVLTIIRAYVVAGRPEQRLVTWGSFEGWSRLVRHALVWAGQADPGKTREKLAANADTEGALLGPLLAGLAGLDAEGMGFTVNEVLRAINLSQHQALRDILLELAPPAPGGAFSPRKVGARLKHLRDRVSGSRRLSRRKGGDGKEVRSNAGALWVVEERDTKRGWVPAKRGKTAATSRAPTAGSNPSGCGEKLEGHDPMFD